MLLKIKNLKMFLKIKYLKRNDVFKISLFYRTIYKLNYVYNICTRYMVFLPRWQTGYASACRAEEWGSTPSLGLYLLT